MSEPSAVALRREIEDRIAARDRAGAVAAVRSAVGDGRLELDALYTGVLTPLLVDTGARWQAGTTRVWEEHYTTSVVRTIIEALSVEVAKAASRVESRGKTALFACPSGEQHDLGLRMLADRAALRGWNAHFLGADTPAAEVIAAAKALDADLVALSAATHYNLVLLRSFVDEVKAGLPGVRVGVGGPAFACNHQWEPEDLLTPDELGLDDEPSGFCHLQGPGG